MSEENITKNDYTVNIEDIMHTAYLQYSLSVNVGRAIPDVRDGLKPGNRRILFAMLRLGLTHSHAYTKSAKVVGEVIGNYHPHGDASVYDTLVRMAQDFSMREPLIDGQGNFGSIDGDPPAAYRYTECRLRRLAEEMLADIDKDTVNMLPTFDEATTEPEVLPAGFPNLLVNGTTGIGVGMATSIPPHNLTEVINAVIYLIHNPNATVKELMEYMPGPDFPTGATICGVKNIVRFYETGKGSVKIRAKAEIMEKDGKETIIVTEIPYAVNKELLVKKIADLVNEKKITGIAALRDETSRRTGIRIVIEIKRNAMAKIVLNQLYTHTALESTLAAIMMVVDHQRPTIMNLRQVLQSYIDHRVEVVTRRTKFELKKAEARAHIVEGLRIAVQNIDEVVKIIRASRTAKDAQIALEQRFNLDRIQSKAIVDMRLSQLTGLAIEDLENEYKELMERIDYLKSLLADRSLLMQVIEEELTKIRDKYGNPRRTEITHSDEDFKMADLIARHSCVITVSNSGYIKRQPADTFRTQHRGGKGVIGMSTKEEDFVAHLFNADSHDIIFFFTNKGNMHWLYVYEIPEADRTSKGRAIVNMIKISPEEQIRGMLTVKKEDVERDDLFIVTCTKNGFIKKTALSAFKNLRKIGIRALIIEEDDDMVAVALTNGNKEIILSTAYGFACRFDESEVRPTGRATRGVTGIRFKIPSDYVVSMEVFDSQTLPEMTSEDNEPIEEEVIDSNCFSGPQLLVITEGGMGKRSYVNTYRKTHRGGKGVLNIKLKPADKVVSVIQVNNDDEIILTSKAGVVVRIAVKEIRVVGRVSQGVKIMKFKTPDSYIVAASKIIRVEDDDETKEDDNQEETIYEHPTSQQSDIKETGHSSDS